MINIGSCLGLGLITRPVMGIMGLIYFALFVLGIYLIVSAIQFFRSSAKKHNELMQKLDELIQVLKKDAQA